MPGVVPDGSDVEKALHAKHAQLVSAKEAQ